MELYENIRRKRKELKMTQQQLADLTGYGDRSSIAKIESGLVDLSQSKLELFAKVLHTTPGDLMGHDVSKTSPLPSNLVSPAAYPLPILGTICAGDGILCEENFEGYFFVDNTIRANYCLHVHGDSMMDAEIYDEDIVFIRKDYEYEDGKIYAVVYGAQQDAVLRKIYRDGGKVILTPCNSSYKPLVMDPDDIFIIGECVGVYRLMK